MRAFALLWRDWKTILDKPTRNPSRRPFQSAQARRMLAKAKAARDSLATVLDDID